MSKNIITIQSTPRLLIVAGIILTICGFIFDMIEIEYIGLIVFIAGAGLVIIDNFEIHWKI